MIDFRANENLHLQPFVDLADDLRISGAVRAAEKVDALIREVLDRDKTIRELNEALTRKCPACRIEHHGPVCNSRAPMPEG